MSVGGLWVVIWRGNWRWLGFVPAAAGLVAILVARPPDLLVARDGETVAFRGAGNLLYLVRHPTDEYSASEWLKRDGDSRTSVQAVAGAVQGVRCDTYGCVAREHGAIVAISTRRGALAEDCANADIVVSSVPAWGFCVGPKLVIDRFDVSRRGAYAVWLGEQTRVETVQGSRGDRPWSKEPWQARGWKSKFSSGE